MSGKSYKIITFGCQMNIADSGVLKSIMDANGYRAINSEDEAEIVILNTCSVREKAETRVLGRLAELSQYKQTNKNKKLVVVGCMAQRLGQQLKTKVPYVDYVLGTDRLFDLPQYLQNGNAGIAVDTEFGDVEIDNVVPSRDSKFAAFVTISRGCNNFCTYCIVPYVRGRERSYPIATIVEQVNRLTADGVLEVTFLGQNVNSYKDGESDFTDLLGEVIRSTDLKRIRFMTSHPKDMSDRLIELIGSETRMMNHVHLPLQAGSDRVLKQMGRGYTYEQYYSLVEKLRKSAESISITTDLIVGFPGESEEDYKMTLAAVEKVAFDSAFMFRYSPRAGTKATRFEDDVPEEEKIRRLNILIDLQKEVAYKKNQGEVGRVESVLVDDFSRRDKKVMKGKTGGNKTILFKGDETMIGQVISVKINEADSWTLHGEIVE